MIGVTFALPTESAEFLKRLGKKSQSDRNGVHIIHGKIGGRAIEVMHTGVGQNVCRERLPKFLGDQKFELLISSGFAGALNDQLQVGDLLLAQNFSTVGSTELPKPAPELALRCGNLLTMPAMIDSNQERTKIARATGAIAVDMETEFIARACAMHGIPLLSLRVITDTPHKPFPAPPNILFDIERQRTCVFTLARFLVKHPSRIRHLVQFAERIARARKTLANALAEIVRGL